MAITPPHMHVSVQALLKAGMFAISTVGMGTSTPRSRLGRRHRIGRTAGHAGWGIFMIGM
jgi:hypothetical protein